MEECPLHTVDPVPALSGSWHFERTVSDASTGATGEATGTATFEPEAEGLAWIESGTLRMGGHTFDAKRRLSIQPDDGSWMVRFDDGRPFHPLRLDQGRCEVGHPCRDDFYDGTLEFIETPAGPEFRTEWRVAGPRKDQLIVTRYRRAS